MDTKMRRRHLNDYTRAHTDILLTQSAIDLMDRVSNSRTILNALKKKRSACLHKMDYAAEKMGAPYGA